MARHIFEQKAACTSCSATGLYVGMAEHDGAAVVCRMCKGTGERTIRIEWEDFTGRRKRGTTKRVYETNPGIALGERGSCYELSNFGGMPYKDWLKGQPFTRGMENRSCTCPCWWYQSADYKLKPDWDECSGNLGRSFLACDHFKNKGMCWSRFDRENP